MSNHNTYRTLTLKVGAPATQDIPTRVSRKIPVGRLVLPTYALPKFTSLIRLQRQFDCHQDNKTRRSSAIEFKAHQMRHTDSIAAPRNERQNTNASHRLQQPRTWMLSLGLAMAIVMPNSVAAADLTLKSLNVKNPITAGRSYKVTLPYKSTGPFKVAKGCFLWSGEGPYCFPVRVGRRTVTVTLRTGRPNKYRLTGYLEYKDHPNGTRLKRTNRVSARIDVRK